MNFGLLFTRSLYIDLDSAMYEYLRGKSLKSVSVTKKKFYGPEFLTNSDTFLKEVKSFIRKHIINIIYIVLDFLSKNV